MINNNQITIFIYIYISYFKEVFLWIINQDINIRQPIYIYIILRAKLFFSSQKEEVKYPQFPGRKIPLSSEENRFMRRGGRK